MPENKTKQTNVNVDKFLEGVDEKKRSDSYAIIDMMKKITKEEPKMWGPTMIGFGSYHYKYESGREGDIFITGFSPRKPNLVLYIMSGFKSYTGLMKKLGKHKTGGGCLYVKKLEDIDMSALKELVKESVKFVKEKYK
jgi:hypothetical protein